MQKELVHVMLRPDALELGLRDVVIRELQQEECEILVSRRLILNLNQIESIYPRFPNARAKPTVFAYFTSRETEHFAIEGAPSLHERLNVVKGRTGTGKGIRGRYYTEYTRLNPSEFQEWLSGSIPNTDGVDLEMFGRGILHVADTQSESFDGLKTILCSCQLETIRLRGFSI